jgi:hypothetical protein
MLIGYQIGNHGVGGLQTSVDEVKETLRQEMVAEFLEMSTEMMGTGMKTKESLHREMRTEINRILMGTEYLREEWAAEMTEGKSGDNMNVRDDFQEDPVSSVNMVIAKAGDVAPRRGQYVGKGVKFLDS